jgi:molybdopterin-dependent oxidoreductase alpha subunit
MTKRWQPSLWASRKPFGIGEQRPNNYLEIWNAISENRRNLRYAWRILKHGVCDGCALGTTGLHDWTLDEIHLCNVRLRLLRLNTMPALDPRVLEDVSHLEGKRSVELRGLGRLPYPMVRRKGEQGFHRVSWDDALDLIAERIRATSPDRLGFYMTSRGQPNENYYAVQKAVRALGSNSIDNAARVCHAPSTFGLKEALGVGATTCSYKDWIGSDLVLFIGSNVASNQPVSMKYLYHAKKEGTKVAVVNSFREPGMARYWVPSNLESALFGTKIADRFFLVNVGGDIAFLNGTLKHMVGNGWVHRGFIEGHATGFAELAAALDEQPWEELERLSGSSREEMLDLARMLHKAETAVLVWSMGITQHECGEDNVRSIINLALAKGFVGRDRCGLMPIRGHSGVQGGAEMGAYSTIFPGGQPLTEENAVGLSRLWGFDVPYERGLTAPEMVDAGYARRLDVMFASGGNFLEVLPDPAYSEEALRRVPLRVHMDIVISTQMLVAPEQTVVLLPAQTRYEIRGGVTETSTERRIIFSPEIPGPRVGEARAEWEVFLEVAKRARPELADKLHFDGTAAIREEIARVVPMYDGIQWLRKAGDEIQYGGRHLCSGWKFPTSDGKAKFSVVALPTIELPEGTFLLATRRGKQFNSMIQGASDPITGAVREAVLMNGDDVRQLGLEQGDSVLLTSEFGELRRRVWVAPMRPGNLEVHWPEGEVLIDRRRRSPLALIPDYNAIVRVERIEGRVPVSVSA